MAFDVVVRSFFTDNGLSAGLAGANEKLKLLAQTGPEAGRGVRSVEMGVRMLAFQAIGVTGPLGRVAGGLLLLGGGSALMLAAAAGIALVGLAIRALTQDARDNAAAQKAMIEELGKIGTHGPVEAARIKLAEAERRRDRPTIGELGGATVKAFVGPVFGGASLAELHERLEREVRVARNELSAAMKKFQDPTERARNEAALGLAESRTRLRLSGLPTGEAPASALAEAEALRVLRLEHEHIAPAIARTVAATERHAAEIDLATKALSSAREGTFEAELRNQMLGASEDAVTEALRRHQLQLQGMPAAVAASVAATERQTAANIKTANVLRTQLPQAFAAMGAAALQGMNAVVQSAISSIGQIAQALPGVTPAQSALIGFATSLIGGLFSRSKPLPVQVTNAAELRPEGVDRFTLQIVSASTGELLDQITYELGRRTRLDRVIRIPRGVIV